MNNNGNVGWGMVISGLVLVGLGVAWLLGAKLNLSLGHLPGDVTITTSRARLYIPITTCILLSGALSFIVWLFGKLFR